MKKGFEAIRSIAILSCFTAIPVILAYISSKLGIGNILPNDALDVITFAFFVAMAGLGVIILIANNETK